MGTFFPEKYIPKYYSTNTYCVNRLKVLAAVLTNGKNCGMMQKPKTGVDFYSSLYYFSPHNGSAGMLTHCVVFCCVWEVHNYE